jgi:hypothetical protein
MKGVRPAPWTRLAGGAGAGARALRDFLRGFTGMPTARLRAGGAGAEVGCDESPSARRALEARSARRASCC